jgi:hypothetical protein
MIGLRPATEEDKLHLAKCFSLDEWHQKEQIENWLEAELTTFFDERGVLLHMCFTDERPTLRLHAQFDPLAKFRTARAIPQVLEIIQSVAVQNGYTALSFWSESPSLIAILEKLRFSKQGECWMLPLEAAHANVRAECSTNH